jgi:hypothetical protein
MNNQPQFEDPLALTRDVAREKLEATVTAMPPEFRPRTIEAFQAMINTEDRQVRPTERCLLADRTGLTRPKSSDFARAYVVAHARGLLESEARSIRNQLLRDGDELTEARLRDELILAVGRARPQSRLRPWHLPDDVMQLIINTVAADMAGGAERWAA